MGPHRAVLQRRGSLKEGWLCPTAVKAPSRGQLHRCRAGDQERQVAGDPPVRISRGKEQNGKAGSSARYCSIKKPPMPLGSARKSGARRDAFWALARAPVFYSRHPDHRVDAPGPFAFADANRVRGVLAKAGFGDIEINAHDEMVGSGDLDAMLAVCTRVGALGKILRENPERRSSTVTAVRSALAAHDGPDRVRLKAATWVVTARCVREASA